MCAVVCVHLLVSLLAPRSIGLTAFGDLTQSALLLCATLAMLSNIRTQLQKSPAFLVSHGAGCGMWLCTQVLWTYFEVFLRQEVPNPFVGDVVLFLHVVPMMAALVVQPHIQQNDHSLRLVSLDFFLLLTWWLYLYLFIVIPWQYVSPNEAAYGRSFDLALRLRTDRSDCGSSDWSGSAATERGTPSMGSFSKLHCSTAWAPLWLAWQLIITVLHRRAFTTSRWWRHGVVCGSGLHRARIFVRPAH